MRSYTTLLIVLGFVLALAGTALAADSGRIYGKIHTVDGDTFEGLIRWDKNEGCWIDVLDGTRDRDDRDRDRRSRSSRRKYDRRRSKIRIFGSDIYLGGGDNWNYGSSAQSGIRMGHIKSMEVVDDDRVLLILKSGKEIEFFNGSTDIGTDIREIVIEDPTEGEIEFSWDDIELIEFSDTRTTEKSRFGDRLYGTLSTRRGEEYTGFVCWDMDELFTNDILDGDEKRRSRKIKFGKIATITRYSSSGAELVLISGDELLLRNSNDIDDGNRGIVISDPGFGQVTVEWDEFESLTFSTAPKELTYDQFDGGRRLRGTVYTEDDDEYTGEICWDDDEEYTWELLNGEYRDNKFEVEFGLIKQIEKNSRRGCEVTVWDGRSFRLRGSNDVDDDNKGIFISQDNGDEVYVEWDDFDRIEFAKQ